MSHPSNAAAVVSRLRPGMGTLIAIEGCAGSADSSAAGVEAAYRAMDLVERLMHPHRDGSDLCALRQGPTARPLPIHPWTWHTLDLCLRLHRDSRGAFDPALPDSPGKLPDLELTSSHRVVAHAPLDLDLGGIAKGFAVDRAVEALRAAGCSAGLVNAGGDLAVFGESPREVLCRRHDGRAAPVILREAALATSEAGGDSHPTGHRGYYRGGGGRPPRACFAAVTAASAAVADGLSTCLLAGATAAILRRYGARRVGMRRGDH